MYLLVLLAFGLTMASEDEQQYCGARYTHLCLGKGTHVACQFPVAGSGPNCANYSKIRFTAELRNVITNFINKRRQRIAAGHERVRGGKHIPTPQVMMYVEWDFELARLAQRLADQCYFVHDDCRATVRYPYAGQSVGEVRWRHLSDNYDLSAQRGIRRVFDAWWGERRRVEPQQLVKPFRITDKGLSWGHFSQLAVWTLRAVGCGAVRHGEEYPRLLLVCDFSHTNMLGEKTLIPGETAPCPEHTRRKARSNFPLLCASVKEQIKNSRVVDEDVIDEAEYDDDEGNSEVLAMQDSLKKLGAIVTRKPKRYTDRDDIKWGNNKLKPTPADDEDSDDETTEKKIWTTAPYIDGHEIVSDDDDDLTTPRGPKAKKIRPRFKTTTTESSVQVIIGEEDDDRGPPVKSDENRFSGFRIQEARERLPIVDSGIDPEHDNDIQETLILAHTSKPLVDDQIRSQKLDRMSNKKMSASTIHGEMIQNPSLQFNTRQRWKPERERPTRPGAAALLRPPQHVPPAGVRQEPAIPPRVSKEISFKMDEDDVEQMQADTGFHPSWKLNATKPSRKDWVAPE
ncbi:uncharacterized protein LOC125238426 isoform X3 [Leguminivora glycinivorella]|uniref:uncharacterized protein LOC125238426 isoform X3 n=1 Tax=Leguminivora glycinivorella TaxID=1035111 RepID=UPI00200F24C5|nr:uncharacterized protein LOC125238426 isoform X3 [Leguminivora glycinivorella]